MIQLSSSDSMNSVPASSVRKRSRLATGRHGRQDPDSSMHVVGRQPLGLGLGQRVQRRLDQAEAAPGAGGAPATSRTRGLARHRRPERREGIGRRARVEMDQRLGVGRGADQRAGELGRVVRAVMGEDQEQETFIGRRLPSDRDTERGTRQGGEPGRRSSPGQRKAGVGADRGAGVVRRPRM